MQFILNDSLQNRVFRSVEGEYSARLPQLSITALSEAAVDDWQDQWLSTQKQPKHFAWNETFENMKTAYPDRQAFGWAYYLNSKLCCLASGFFMPFEHGGSVVQIDDVESLDSKDNPLRGRTISMIFHTAERVAQAYGCTLVRANRPLYKIQRLLKAKGYVRTASVSLHGFLEKKITLG